MQTCELLSQAGGCIGSTCFLGAEDLSNSVDNYTDRVRDAYDMLIRFLLQDVHRFESP
jgi:hypothetical protein